MTAPKQVSSSLVAPITDAEPRPTSTNIDVCGLTDRGRVRSENQDQFLIASLHKLLRVHQSSLPPEDITTLISESRGHILLVADGVGEVARLAVAALDALDALGLCDATLSRLPQAASTTHAVSSTLRVAPNASGPRLS